MKSENVCLSFLLYFEYGLCYCDSNVISSTLRVPLIYKSPDILFKTWEGFIHFSLNTSVCPQFLYEHVRKHKIDLIPGYLSVFSFSSYHQVSKWKA